MTIEEALRLEEISLLVFLIKNVMWRVLIMTYRS